jgi:probable H4MPT-linked C1 transfer pathway protein
MAWLGLDIGGANLKAADGRGWARSMPFALWRNPSGLMAAVRTLASGAPDAARFALVMSGELCDCFSTKAEGVQLIVAAVVEAVARQDIDAVRVYLPIADQFATVQEVCKEPELAAASNWLALARVACREVTERSGLLVDIGSTTTDIVPVVAGRPCPQELDDTARLVVGELVYTGVGRTPVCAVVERLPWRGEQCPVAAELFATTGDAYVLLGMLAEQPDARWTADSRPLTAEFARARLARMICADAEYLSQEDALRAAAAVRDRQVAQLCASLARVVSVMEEPPRQVVLSGIGEALARDVVKNVVAGAEIISLSAKLGAEVSACAAAHAVAVLAREADQS